MSTSKIAFPDQRKRSSATSRVAAGILPSESSLVSQELFLQMLQLEQRRTERSGRPFLLILISGEDFQKDVGTDSEGGVITSISGCIRETDVFGWYEKSNTLGLMMTEIGDASSKVIESIVHKISVVLQKSLSAEVYCQVALVVRVFPNESEDMIFHLDTSKRSIALSIDRGLKRTIDILGSLTALIMLSPVFLIIAILVKCTSKGPVFFCRKRLGQYGREFSFYKFRTMKANNDPNIHREFVAKLISGGADAKQNGGLFKLKNDPRITPIGRFLRRSSLDELPQFFNVLLNDMSLVGPRPPLPYEYEKYSEWHKRRVLELKPGITGLWQVEARSLTTFDEMVRIDIRYANARNIWLDLKIMLQTPAAMLSGRGAC
jgi:lipopolysaccharide/colanic/teichoic acid biosynthesis glycosyltransferase